MTLPESLITLVSDNEVVMRSELSITVITVETKREELGKMDQNRERQKGTLASALQNKSLSL